MTVSSQNTLKYFLFCISLIPTVLSAQSKIFTINSTLVNDSILVQSGCLKKYSELKNQLFSTGQKAIEVFLRNQQYAQKLIEGGCISAAHEKQLKDSVLADQNRILAFEKYYTDTVALLKEELVEISTKIINSILMQILEGQSSVFVFDQSVFKFADDSCNLSVRVINKVNQRVKEPAFRRRLDLAVNNVVKQLKIAERLKFQLKPIHRSW